MTVQCRTCGGTYVDVLPDGTRYFHACPPLAVWEVRQALATNVPVLTPVQRDRLAQLDKLPPPLVVPATYVPPGDAYLLAISVERPNKRDENIDPAKVKAAPKDTAGNIIASVPDEALMKAPGLGIVELPDAAV